MSLEHAPTEDPLSVILPDAADRRHWACRGRTVDPATGEAVLVYEHHAIGRALRLDRYCRVYGQDPEGTVRLFGRGGALALAVALNAVFDGMDHCRPTRIHIPAESTRAVV